ncbi:2-oxo acid dehydrogenase subunit E2, partial [bacterium]|nr:2-oxo acid dehydrogenase subunit E2 [bacterium]
MIIDVTVPKWGLTMKEVEIVKWLKNEGDMVEKDEPLVEVTTEKISN